MRGTSLQSCPGGSSPVSLAEGKGLVEVGVGAGMLVEARIQERQGAHLAKAGQPTDIVVDVVLKLGGTLCPAGHPHLGH